MEKIQRYDISLRGHVFGATKGEFLYVSDLKTLIEKEKERIAKEIHDTQNENSIMVLSGMRSSLDNLLVAIGETN